MKWLLQNAKQRAAFALKNPRYALGAMLRELSLADEKFLAQITGASVDAIREYLDEPISSPAFSRHLREAEQKFRDWRSPAPISTQKRYYFRTPRCVC